MIVDIFQIQHNIYPPNVIEENYYRYAGTSLPQCGNIVTALR